MWKIGAHLELLTGCILWVLKLPLPNQLTDVIILMKYFLFCTTRVNLLESMAIVSIYKIKDIFLFFIKIKTKEVCITSLDKNVFSSSFEITISTVNYISQITKRLGSKLRSFD